MSNAKTKGFTLIELLVVIAIVAILAVVVILTLNPAELLRQARDSNRISDLNTMKSTIALYLADVVSPSITDSSSNCYTSVLPATATCTGRTTATATSSKSGVYSVNANGWVPVNFTSISSGSPLGNLPKDPVNNATYFYNYVGNSASLQYELDADMESVKYTCGGGSDVELNDGGTHPASTCTGVTLYEVGTNLAL